MRVSQSLSTMVKNASNIMKEGCTITINYTNNNNRIIYLRSPKEVERFIRSANMVDDFIAGLNANFGLLDFDYNVEDFIDYTIHRYTVVNVIFQEDGVEFVVELEKGM